MPKKPSDFLNKKRSRGNGDFARPKAKVGRKVKRRAGETDASFQTRQLSITEQSVAKDPDRDFMYHPKGPVVRGLDPADLCEETLGAYLGTLARARSGAPS